MEQSLAPEPAAKLDAPMAAISPAAQKDSATPEPIEQREAAASAAPKLSGTQPEPSAPSAAVSVPVSPPATAASVPPAQDSRASAIESKTERDAVSTPLRFDEPQKEPSAPSSAVSVPVSPPATAATSTPGQDCGASTIESNAERDAASTAFRFDEPLPEPSAQSSVVSVPVSPPAVAVTAPAAQPALSPRPGGDRIVVGGDSGAGNFGAGYPSSPGVRRLRAEKGGGTTTGASVAHAVRAAEALLSPTRASRTSYEIVISRETYELLKKLRKDGESDGDVVERALQWVDSLHILGRALEHSTDLKKAAFVVQQMRSAGYEPNLVANVCRALFGRQTEEEMKKAFKAFDTDKSKFIEREELERALPLMGENVDQRRIDELFKICDADNSGLIDFDEFCVLIKSMNPKDGEDGGAFSAFKAVEEVVGSAASGAGTAISAVSEAWSANIRGLSPFEMRKAGVVLKNMKAAGHSETMAVAVVKAMFRGQTAKDMRRAFKFFDQNDTGSLDKEEFRKCLPLLGEEIDPKFVDELFVKVDRDGTGTVNLEEFSEMLRAMNPKEPETGQDSSAVPDGPGMWQEWTKGWWQ